MLPADEREGLPSGSSALYDSLCFGRWQAQQRAAELMEQEASEEADAGEPVAFGDSIDADAEAGKRIHLLYANKECPNAKPAEIERAEAAQTIDTVIRGEWLSTFDDDPETPIREYRERRWWVKGEQGNKLYSGQTDVVWIRGKEDSPADALIGDLKGLWGYHDPAPINMQIRRYAAILSHCICELGYSELRSVWAYLNQPAVTMTPRIVLLTSEDLILAEIEMWTDLARMMQPDAQRTAGPVQCHRCKAKLICPEFIAEQDQHPVLFKGEPPAKDKIETALQAVSNEKLAALLDWRKALLDLVVLGEREARRRLLSDPQCLNGYKLKKNPSRHPINDVAKIYGRVFNAYAIKEADFIRACGLSKEALGEMVRAASSLKGKALQEKIKELCEDATGETPLADSIVKET